MSAAEIGYLEPYARGRGFQNPVAGKLPAAGSSFSYTLDSRYYNRLRAIRFVLTTDGNAASRLATVQYLNADSVIYFEDGAAVLQTASGTGTYNGQAGRGTSEWNTGTPVWFPLFGEWLTEAATIKINVASIQAGDTITGIYLLFEQVHRDTVHERQRQLAHRHR